MKVKLLSTLCLLLVVLQSEGANVLVVYPMVSYSHYHLGNKLVHALADHGHNVTTIAAFRDKNLPKSCKEVYLDGLFEEAEAQKKMMFVEAEKRNFLYKFSIMIDFGPNNTRNVLSHPETQKFLRDTKQKFDVVVVEEFFNHALKALAYHFDAPLVVASTMGTNPWVNKLVGNPAPWSYTPSMLLGISGRMNLWQRILNVLSDSFAYVFDLIVTSRMNDIIDEFFPGAPHVEELNNNVSVILLNSHVSTNSPAPLLPNMIEIGGYHVDKPKKLPEDLKKYLDGCKNGFIYFSMGSNFQSKYIENETMTAILSAFSKLPWDILWKFEDDDLPGKPPNVKILKWLPQQDILAHENIKLFITHGGLLSTIETIYHGVPIIGLPAFGDQKTNIGSAVAAGYALELDLNDLSEEKLSAAINEILSNPKYAETAKRRSLLMRDREIDPKDTAVFWIEYAIRHRGEKHYRSAALDLAWYELYMVDAAAFAATVTFLVLYLTYKLLKYLCSKRVKKTKKKQA